MRSLSSLADGCKILAASIARRAKIWLTILASLEVKNLAAGEASPFTLHYSTPAVCMRMLTVEVYVDKI